MELMPSDPRPWYREFWAWFFIAILSLGVGSGVAVLVIGIQHAPQMVGGDYQKLGKALVDTHRRTDRARLLGLQGQLEAGGDTAVLSLKADEPDHLPEQLLLRFEHPVDASRDVSTVARRIRTDAWQAAIGEIALPRRARVVVSDLEQSWWLHGRFRAEPAGRIVLTVQQP